LRTDVHGTDGFFAAVFQRKAKAVVPKADAEGAIEAATEAEADALPAQGAEASEPEVAVAEESPVLRDDSEVQLG
jgi:16S rRNA (cytosine967-C5)-methyltransferase